MARRVSVPVPDVKAPRIQSLVRLTALVVLIMIVPRVDILGWLKQLAVSVGLAWALVFILTGALVIALFVLNNRKTSAAEPPAPSAEPSAPASSTEPPATS